MPARHLKGSIATHVTGSTDRGGTLRPGGNVTGMEGPDLSHVGLKGYNAEWYAAHLQKSQQATDPAWKTSFREVSRGRPGGS